MSEAVVNQWMLPILIAVITGISSGGMAMYRNDAVNVERIEQLKDSITKLENGIANTQVLLYRAESLERAFDHFRDRQDMVIGQIQRLDKRMLILEKNKHLDKNGHAGDIYNNNRYRDDINEDNIKKMSWVLLRKKETAGSVERGFRQFFSPL